MLRQRRARTNGHAPRRANGVPAGRSVVLSEDELTLVLAACQRYRHSIPTYLASSQPQLQLIKALIRKLS